MIDPGTLKHRLTLHAPVETPDGAGGVIRSFAPTRLLWASMNPLGARGQVLAAATGSVITHRIVVRASPDITTRHYLTKGARTFRIVTARELDNEGRFTELNVEERMD